MQFHLFRNLFLGSALCVGVLFAAPVTPAQAAGSALSIQIGSGGVQLVQHRQREIRGERHRGRHHARPRVACAPEQALRKANRLGVNRARLVRADRRAVVVQGRSRGDRVTVRFAQQRGCPVIAYR